MEFLSRLLRKNNLKSNLVLELVCNAVFFKLNTFITFLDANFSITYQKYLLI